jgi:nucleotide-binding universal stress UspA family protein
MPLTFIVFAGFYPEARHAVAYADALACAVGGRLVVLHINRVSSFDPYDLLAEGYHRAELDRQADTATLLGQLAAGLCAPATVEIATDLLPTVAHSLVARHHPVLFVLGQPDPAHSATTTLAEACAELLRAGGHPLLVLPPASPGSAAAAVQLPRRILIGADSEGFALAPAAQALGPLLALPGAQCFVAHVSSGVEDDEGCALALRAVQASGLLAGAAAPELRGYENPDYGAGLLAAASDTQADLVVVVARPRSYLGELFHHSVTAYLLAHCPVPLLVLPTTVEAPPTDLPGRTATVAEYATVVLNGLSPAA